MKKQLFNRRDFNNRIFKKISISLFLISLLNRQPGIRFTNIAKFFFNGPPEIYYPCIGIRNSNNNIRNISYLLVEL